MEPYRTDDPAWAGYNRTLESLRDAARESTSIPRFYVGAPRAASAPRDRGIIRATTGWDRYGYVRPQHEEAMMQAATVLDPVAQGEGLADTVRAVGRLVTGEGDADDVVDVAATATTAMFTGKGIKGRGKPTGPAFEYSVRAKGSPVSRTGVAPMGAPVADHRAFSGATRKINSMKERFFSRKDAVGTGPSSEAGSGAGQKQPIRQYLGGDRVREARRHPDYVYSREPDGPKSRRAVPQYPIKTVPDVQVLLDSLNELGARSRKHVFVESLATMDAAYTGTISRGAARVGKELWKSFAAKHPKTAKFVRGVMWSTPFLAGGYAVADAVGDAQVAAAKKEQADFIRASYSNDVDQARLRLARHEAASTNAASVAAFWRAPTEALIADLDSMIDDYKTISDFDRINAPPADTVSRILHNYGHTPAPNRDRYTGKELPDYSEQFNRFVEAYRAKKEAVNAR